MREPKLKLEITDWSNLDKDAFKFYFDQAEKRLSAALSVADRATQRAFSILTGLIPLITLLLATLTKHYYLNDQVKFPVLEACWTALVFSFVVLGLLMKVIHPRKNHQLGSEPKHLANPAYFDNPHYPPPNAYIVSLREEIQDFQNRIEETEAQNVTRIRLIRISLYLLSAGFAAYTILLSIKALAHLGA